MPSLPPCGEPVPADGRLPQDRVTAGEGTPLGLYVHVPFCRVRCGYCDFNTYVPGEPGLAGPDGVDDPAGPAAYPRIVGAELALAARVLADAGVSGPAETVFVGGGTPTMLGDGLLDVLAAARASVGIAPGAEITVEANPDTVTAAYAERLARAGVTRLSLGMQSAVPSVLATLDRTHAPANVATAVAAARAAGMAVSLDLIYGAPGESLGQWRASLDAAIALEPDHVSAYALVVEQGTKLAARVRRGEVAMPDDDDEADKYELADETLRAAGYGWYEVSNWARTDAGVCRHNLLYWRGANWWGAGPGAHSHVDGVRWWNVRHPRAYADRLASGASPGHERELLDRPERYDEDVLLASRLGEGLPLTRLDEAGRRAVAGLVADGLVEAAPALRGGPAPAGVHDTSGLGPGEPSDPRARRVVLTRRGRLLADAVVHRLLG